MTDPRKFFSGNIEMRVEIYSVCAAAAAYHYSYIFDISASRVGLVCSSPERPRDNELGVGAFSSEACSDATDFLHRPSEKRAARQRGIWRIFRRIIFGGVAALA